ncbi:uncharacterized protein LOC106696325 isoform X2 [Myotis lucifugus]|uniref:uncharacterized protein LOC106696325 isoform X2 n=1 Tax=Myotis lucifugus TaxID=59463 RepID=UPI0006D70D37|nr:uncharacterized protein LOC106696325 isoform X2 [Myotis lucifugus]
MWKRQTQPLLPSDLEPGHSTLPAAIKIIYWDLISPDETFSDICQIWVIRDKLCLEVEEMDLGGQAWSCWQTPQGR